MRDLAVLRALARAISEENLVTDAAAVRPFETDGLTAIRERPWAVAVRETV